MKLPQGRIDPHGHARDEEWSHKATIASTMDLADQQGVDAFFDMPILKRPVTDRHRVAERLALVPPKYKDRYGLYVGLTDDEEQILEALWCYNNFGQVVGFKLFNGRSVGDLSVEDAERQLFIWRILAREDFRGVVANHCEKESEMMLDLWDPSHPISHTLARPPKSEIESVRDQISFALLTGFKGRVHICHASCPETVTLVNGAKVHGLKASCGATPHHLMWDERRMLDMDGWFYKTNPPLRSYDSVMMLRQLLIMGMIDCVETDHAPHTFEEKKPPQCLSGYPSLELYRTFVEEFLPNLGLSEDEIWALTRDNILEIFSDKL